MGCTVGARTRIWQNASVIRRAEIGEDCRIAAGAMIDGSQVGSGSIVSHAAFVGPGAVIGEGVFLGPFVALCNDAWPRANKDGFDVAEMIGGKFVTTLICGGASICSHVTILPGIKIGHRAMVAAGVVVTEDVPSDHLLRRDGSLVPIDHDRKPTRMRAASA